MIKQHPADHHILLVEDDVGIADMLIMLLEGEGYEIVLAPTAYEALTLLQAGKEIDLIVLDLQLPGMDGVSFVKQATTTVGVLPPVIVLSAKRPVTVDAAADEIGAVGALHKPFQIAELLALVRQVVGGGHGGITLH